MRIDIKDLPLNLQKQALRKLAEEEAKALHSIVKRSVGEVEQRRVAKSTGEASSGVAMHGDGIVKQSNTQRGNCIDVRCGAKAGQGKVVFSDGNAEKNQSKYRAKKVTLPLPDGTMHTFDSKHEADIYTELSLQERAGEISNLQIQVPYELIPTQKAPSGKTYRNCKYIADFVYRDKDGNTVVCDAKGYRTKEYSIKRKLMLLMHGIEISEV